MRVAVLPTRDAVLLPGAVNELQVGRPGSVAALRHAAEHDDQALVVLQRDPDVDDPGPADLHAIGTICRVTDAERMSAEAACVGVLGLERVRLSGVERGGDALFAEVEALPWSPSEPPMPDLLRDSLGFLIDQGLGAQFSARTFQALKSASTVERVTALSVLAPIDAARLQGVLERGALEPIVQALLTLRDESWLARLLRWIRR